MANSDFVKHYFEWCEFLQDRDKPQFRRTLETRTRRGDITDALPPVATRRIQGK